MSEWEVDIAAKRARHSCGAEIIFSGHPESNSFDGKPNGFPAEITAIEQVVLIRTGFEAYRKAHQKKSPGHSQLRRKSSTAERRPVIKSKSNRPIMSLKRSTTESSD
ncbi:MAG: hypothetical protein CSA49_06810 [Gammaproteobacteria bacterium]|nr:MAG: hypothetical protein CSA49_06810 [Gammaproteobacteria bacterium]